MNQEIIKRLKNLRMIDTEIMSKRQEIAELRSKILKGQQYSDMPKVEKLGNGNEVLNIKIIDDTIIINEDINKLYKERQILTTAINNLDDALERNVIRLFYINRYTWNEIAAEFNCSVRTAHNIRDSGVKNLSKVLHTFT